VSGDVINTGVPVSLGSQVVCVSPSIYLVLHLPASMEDPVSSMAHTVIAVSASKVRICLISSKVF